jgi:hypothetical protein
VGGQVTFTVPTTGASAVLSSNSAIIDANGLAEVMATPSGSGGTYTLTARTAGAMDVTFTLTNLAPPAVTGVAAVTHSKGRISQITLGFSEDLMFGSATSGSFFSVLAGTKKRHNLVFGKPLKISAVSYDGTTDRVTITLAKPFEGRAQVTVYGGIKGTDGLSSHGDFAAVVH